MVILYLTGRAGPQARWCQLTSNDAERLETAQLAEEYIPYFVLESGQYSNAIHM